MDINQALKDFTTTIQAKPNLTNEEIKTKFPEFNNNDNLVQSARDYAATSLSGKYNNDEELNSKFPELFVPMARPKNNIALPGVNLPDYSPENALKPEEASQTIYGNIPGTTKVGDVNFLPIGGNYQNTQNKAPKQITPEAPKEQLQGVNTDTPEVYIPGQTKEIERNNYAQDLLQRINAGAGNMFGGAAKYVSLMYKNTADAFDVPLIGEYFKIGEGLYNKLGDVFLNDAKGSKLASDRYKGVSFTDLWKEGRYTDALGEVFLTATESLPQSITAVGLTMAGQPQLAAGTMYGTSAGLQYDQLKDNEDMTDVQRQVNAHLTGIVEAASEYLGDIPVGRWLNGIIKTQGKEAAKNIVKSGFKQTAETIMKKSGLLFPMVAEGLEEIGSQLGANVVDYATGAKDKLNITDGVFESFVYGAAGGSQFSSVGAVAQTYNKIKSKKDFETADNSLTATFSRMGMTREDVDYLKDNFIGLAPEKRGEALQTILQSADVTEEDIQKISDYFNSMDQYASTNDKFNKEVTHKRNIQSVKEEVSTVIQPLINPKTNSFITAEVNGIKTQIVDGLVVLNEEGLVDTANSEQEIVYLDENGQRQVTSITNVGEIFENIPGEQAVQQAQAEATAPIQAEYDNSQVRPYEKGEKVRLTNGQVGEIVESAEGKYLFQDLQGNMAEIEPRSIVNEDNIKGINPGDIVTALDENQQPVEGEVDFSQDLRAQGLAEVGGQVVAIETIKKKAIEPQNKQNATTAPSGDNNVSVETTSDNLKQPETTIPSDEKGNMLFEQAAPEVTLSFLNENFEPEEVVAVVDSRINDLNKQISKISTFKPTGNIQKDIQTKQAQKAQLQQLNEQLGYWNGIKQALTPKVEAIAPKEVQPVVQPVESIIKRKAENKTGAKREGEWGEVKGLRDLVVRLFANRGQRVRWNDLKSDNGSVISRGLGGEYRYSEAERRAHLGVTANDAPTPEQLAHAIWQENEFEQGEFVDFPLYGVDTQEILNEVLDVLNTYTKGEMIQAGYDMNISPEEVAQVEQAVEEVFNNSVNEIDNFINNPEENPFFVDERELTPEENGLEQYFNSLDSQSASGNETSPGIASEENEGSNHISDVKENDKQAVLESSVDNSGINGSSEGVDGLNADMTENSPEIIAIAKKLMDKKPLTSTEQAVFDNENTKKLVVKAVGNIVIEKEEKVSKIKSSKPDKQTASTPQAQIQQILDSYDNSVNITMNDVINDILTVAYDNDITSIQEAYKTYQDELREDREQFGERGDREAIENNFMQVVEEYLIQSEQAIDDVIASQDINTNPTEAQKEAGNYKKGHVVIQDMDITVENPKGSVRRGVDEDGKAWEHEMNSHYGYFKGTVGKDGDHVDTFIGNNPESKQVFVIDQTNPKSGKFDESKVMIGYESAEQAKAAYLENYDKDWKGFYAITEVSVDDFKTWLYDGKKQHKPYAEYKDTPKPIEVVEKPTESIQSGSTVTYKGEQYTIAEKWDDGTVDLTNKEGYLTHENVPVSELSQSDQPLEKVSSEQAEVKPEVKNEPKQPTSQLENSEKLSERFEAGKKLSKEEKQEVLKGLKDSYKVMNRPRIQVQDNFGNEKYEWDGDSADYMQTSDITGRKVRWYIVMPDGKLAHPTELYPEIPLSEIEREAKNIEYQEQLADSRYKTVIDALNEKGETEKVFNAIQTAIDNGAKFEISYDSNDKAQRNPFVGLRFPNEAYYTIPKYVIHINGDYMGITDRNADKGLMNFTKSEIDWERFYNENNIKLSETQIEQPVKEEVAKSENKESFQKSEPTTNQSEQIGKLLEEKAQIKAKKDKLVKELAARNGLFGDTKADPNDLFGGEGVVDVNAASDKLGEYNARMSEIDRQVAELKKNEATGLKESQGQKQIEEEKEISPIPELFTVQSFNEFEKKFNNGEIKLDDYKKAFEVLSNSKETIVAELSTKTKDDLIKMLNSWSRYGVKSEKKDRIVNAIYDDMLMTFTFGSIEYDFSTTTDVAISRKVAKATQSDIDNHVKEVQKQRDDYKKRLEEFKKALTNPETLTEFRIFIDKNGINKLSLEQKAKYDELVSDRAQEIRKKNQETQAQISKVDGVSMSDVIESKHTKTGEPLFVVKLNDRVDKDTYYELNSKAKKLGGSYSSYNKDGAIPGFQFKSREDAEKFKGLETESVSTINETTQEDKIQIRVSKLRDNANKMIESADTELNRERLTNTSKRASEAGRMEDRANEQKRIAQTMLNIADAIDNGDVKLLDGINAKTHIQLLDSLIEQAKRAELNSKYTEYSERQKHQGEPATLETIEFLRGGYYPSIYSTRLKDLVNESIDRDGVKRVAAQWQKITSKLGDNGSYQLKSDRDVQEIQEMLEASKENYFFNQIKEAIANHKRLKVMGIENDSMLRAALREYIQYRGVKGAIDKVKQLERNLVGKNVGIDFFPTPKKVVSEMLDYADIQEGMSILEPSAGNGNIADAIKEQGIKPDVIEISSPLREVLDAKGYNLIGDDFMAFSGQKYDRIVMNPPFGTSADIDHVLHAYELLNPNGKVVSVMSESTFFRNDAKSVKFREFLDNNGAEVIDVEAGAFNDKTLLNTTGVKTRIVVIDKQEGENGALFDVIDQKSKEFNSQKDLNIRHELAIEIINETKKALSLSANTFVAKDYNDLASEFERQGLKAVANKIRKVTTNTDFRGLYLAGTVYIVSSKITDSKQLIKTYLHEAIHDSNAISFTKEQLEEFYDNNKNLVESLISTFYYDYKKSEQADEAITRAIEKLNDNYSIEEIYNGVSLDSMPKPIIELAKQTLNTFSNGNYGRKNDTLSEMDNSRRRGNDAPGLYNAGNTVQDLGGINRQEEIGTESGQTDRGSDRRTSDRIEGTIPETITVDGVERPTTNSDGEVIHSTEEGVRNFYAWFKDSKVVDESGRPLVVYHTTNAEFTIFSKKKSKEGFFFSPNESRLSDYNKSKTDAYYLSLQNPSHELFKSDVNELSSKGYDGIMDYGHAKKINANLYEIIAFSPTQIKSATGNNGGFDPNNADIRYQIIGEQGAHNLDKAEEATTRLDNLRVAKEMEKGGKERKVLFVDNDGKNIVYDDGNYRIAVNDPEKATYITLWHKEEVKGKEYWAKRGYLNTNETNQNRGDNGEYKGKYLSISSVEIDKENRGSGYGKKLYKALENFAGDDIKGIYSYLPNRVNKREVPTIYKRMNAKVVDGDHQFVNFNKTTFTPQEIRLATGWEKGVDGLWRYEVADGKVNDKHYSDLLERKFNEDIKSGLINATTLGELYDSKELYNAFPELENMQVILYEDDKGEGRALYNPDEKTIYIYNPLSLKSIEGRDSNLIHEIQHAVQDLENFAVGGNPDIAWEKSKEFIIDKVKNLKGWRDILAKEEWMWKPESLRSLEVEKNQFLSDYAAKKLSEDGTTRGFKYDQYLKLAGEVEARNASTRMNFTAEQRRNTLLSETADVAPEDQIILFDSGVSNSIQDVISETGENITEKVRDELDIKLNKTILKINSFDWKEAYVDKFAAVEEFLNALRNNGTEIKDYNDWYKKATHLGGMADAQLQAYERVYNLPLIEEINKLNANYRDVENYIMLKHGLERNEYMRDVEVKRHMEQHPNADEANLRLKLSEKDYSGLKAIEEEVGVTAEEFIANFEAGHDTTGLWNKINLATRNALQKQFDGGMINKATLEELTTRYKYYIPLRGHDKEVAEDRWDYNPDMGTYFVAPLIKAKGRVSRAEKPFAYIFSMNQSAIVQSNKNSLNQSILRLARTDKSGIMTVSKAWYEYVGEEDGIPKYELRSPEYSENAEQYAQNIDEFEDRMRTLAEQGLAKQKSGTLNVGLFIKPKQAAQHEVHVYQNGTEYVIYINGNPKVARAINGANLAEPGKAIETIGNVSRFMAANFTTRNPLFVMSNFSRDYIYSSTILGVKEGMKYAKNFQKNIPHAAKSLQRSIAGKADINDKWDNYAIEYVMNGGKTGYSHIVELKKIEKRIQKEIEKNGKVAEGGAILRALAAANEFAENLSRLSVYITSREEGRSITQSISDAKEVTVNFNRVGSGQKGAVYFKNFYLFVNVAIQALNNIIKVGKKNPGGLAAIAATFVSTGLLFPLLASLMGGDDAEEAYVNLTEWERHNNFCIWTGNGFVKIPLPQELRVFHALGDNIYMAMKGKSTATETVVNSIYTFSDLLPLNPLGATKSWTELLPDAIKPPMQIVANKSFTGNRIINPFADENQPGYQQSLKNKKGEPFAPYFLVRASEAINDATGGDAVVRGIISPNPDIINHIMRGYFGGLYTMSAQAATTTEKAVELAMGEEVKVKVRETPLRQFYTSEDDITEDKTGMNKEYFKVSDEVKETNRQIKGYQKEVEKLYNEGADINSLSEQSRKIYEMNTFKHQALTSIVKQINYLTGKLDEIDDPKLQEEINRLKQLSIEINKLEDSKQIEKKIKGS